MLLKTPFAAYLGAAALAALAVGCGGALGGSTGSAGASTMGAAGSPTAGAAGSSTAGAAGASTTGAAGASTAGAAGASTTGAAGSSTAGAAGSSTTGAAGSSTAGAAGSSPAGAAGSSTTGAAGSSTAGATGAVCAIPAAAAAADVSHQTTVVGDGTAPSCTAAKIVAAVAAGGVVTFSCGAAPLTIVVPEIEIINDGGITKDGSVTIDGGGKITLSGGGKNRILRQNPCDQTLHYTTTHCNNQDTPHLVLQNLALTAGAGAADEVTKGGLLGGGAVFVGGGTFKAVSLTVTNSHQTNAAGQLVQDLAGGAIYTVNLSTTGGPTFVVGSTFEDNSAINGGALGSIGTSWTILNTVFKNNAAMGHGENPARSGTQGGGLGGAIYNDGNGFTLTICGSRLENGQANELGSGAICQVADDLKGALVIDRSTFTGNSVTGDVQASAKHPGIYVQARDRVNGTSGVTITATTF